MYRMLAAAVLALVGVTGCFAPVATTAGIKVPSDSARVCKDHCSSIGLELGAVAIMANNVGCVCQAPAKARGKESASITAGMATIALQQQEQERQRQQQMQQQQHYRPH